MISGHVEDDTKLYLRTALAHGKIEGEEFHVTLNTDNKAVFVELTGKRVAYYTADMVQDAYEMLRVKTKRKCGSEVKPEKWRSRG